MIPKEPAYMNIPPQGHSVYYAQEQSSQEIAPPMPPMSSILVEFVSFIEKTIRDQVNASKARENNKVHNLSHPYSTYMDLVPFPLGFYLIDLM